MVRLTRREAIPQRRYHGDDDPTRRVIDRRTFIANVGLISSCLATASP
ncbi:MAG: hypothetical protein ACYTG0_40995 [Planctomycetota bacterium]